MTTNVEEEAVRRIVGSAQDSFERQRDANYQRTDRTFIALMLGQWVFAILVALLWSPYAWEGRRSNVHLHVWIASIGGLIINCFPIALGILRPAGTSTRHIMAASQMLWSMVLIHLTGGRIETHFHIFGSLAFLSFYRDWRVLVTASIVTVLDHFARGQFWPESIYGISNPEPWRFLEHAAWVVFCDVFLILSCIRGVGDMRAMSDKQAQVEAFAQAALLKQAEAG